MLLLIDALCVLVATEAIVARWPLPGLSVRLVARFVVAYAIIAGAGLLLGFLGLISAAGFLFLHGAAAIIAATINERPTTLVSDARRLCSAVRDGINGHPELAVLGLAVVVAYGIGAWLIWRVPPNNWDSMTYHLARVAYWLQERRFYPAWSQHRVMQNAYPMNGELGVLWTLALWGSDRLAGGVQWTAALFGIVAVAGCARALGAGRGVALTAGLLWATLPQVVLQSTSTQNDVVASVLLLAAAYGLLLGSGDKQTGSWPLSALALGLALGTKTTAVMALPGFVLGAALLWRRAAVRRAAMLRWSGMCVLAWLAFAAPGLVANCFVYGAPLGAVATTDYYSTRTTFSLASISETALKYSYQSVDLLGLPQSIVRLILPLKAHLGMLAFSALGLEANRVPAAGFFSRFDFFAPVVAQESLSWLGPLGPLLMLGAVVDGIRSMRRGDAGRLLLLLTALGFSLVLVTTLRWQPWSGRYFLIAGTLCAPLSARYLQPRACPVMARGLLVALALLVLACTVAYNESKALLGPHALWGRDRIALQCLQRPSMEPLVRLVEQVVPARARLGTVLGTNDPWDYVLFGSALTRTVTPLTSPPVMTAAWCAQQDVDFLLVDTDAASAIDATATEGRRIWMVDHWMLLALTPATAAGR